MARRRALLSALLCGALVTACGGEVEDEAADPTASPGPGSGWTVLVYSMADTDLEPFMLEDVDELGSVTRSEDVALRALVDRSMTYSDAGVLDVEPWSGAKVLDVGDGTATVVEEVDDLNLGDPATLQRFVAEGMAAHPNDNYALVISDHGASWPGVGPDESAGDDVLTLEETRDALTAALDQAGEDRLDLLGFDACLMATYETASALQGVARRMLASQELEPGHGWDYRDLQLLVDEPATTADELGRRLIEGFEAQAVEAEQDVSITLSLLDLERLPALDNAVTAFSEALQERAPDVASAVGATAATTLGFGRNPDPASATHSLDLGLLAANIGVEALQVSDEADAVQRALGDVVLDKHNGPANQGASGLSIYFPPTADLYDAAYAEVPTASSWADFLGSYFSAAADITAESAPAFLDAAATPSFEDGLLRLDASFDPGLRDSLVSATIRYAVVEDDGTRTFYGSEPAELLDDGVLGYYDLTRLLMSDGEDSAYAFYGLTRGSNGLDTIGVPMSYTDPGSDEASSVLLQLVQDAETGDLLSEVYYQYDPEVESYGELSAEADGLIVPEVLTVSPDGDEVFAGTTDVGLFADLPSIEYDLERLPAGTVLHAELVVTSLDGTTATASATVTVP